MNIGFVMLATTMSFAAGMVVSVIVAAWLGVG
jgi:hypothetical protein